MRPVVLIDNFDSFTYNLYQMLQPLTAHEVQVYRNNALSFDELCEKQPSAVVLSPGPGHPKNEKDFGLCKDVILKQNLLNCPVLGVCLGYQGMVYHLGGELKRAPEVMHGKTSVIRQQGGSPLFKDIPTDFEVMRYHSLVACYENFPKELEIIAQEPVDDIIMAIQHRDRPMFGVQFHPESIGTPLGSQILKNFLDSVSKLDKTLKLDNVFKKGTIH